MGLSKAAFSAPGHFETGFTRVTLYERFREPYRRRFEALHRDGMPWSDMAVLYCVKFIGEEVSSRLRAAGIPVAWLTRSRDARLSDPRDSAVKVVIFHSSKGLEFPVVAIPGLGFLPDSRNAESEEVRLAYVAMTRAMDRLFMTYHRDSPFVQRILDTGASLAA